VELSAPLEAMLAPGAYEAAVRSPFNGASPGISVTGQVGCNTVAGRFVVHEIEFDGAGKCVAGCS